MTIERNKTFAAALLAACAAIAVPAAAQARPAAGADDGRTSVVVDHSDLDLAQPAGRETLEGRLRAAARAVCGAPEREELRAYFARRDCYRQALVSAMREAGAGQPLVAAAR